MSETDWLQRARLIEMREKKQKKAESTEEQEKTAEKVEPASSGSAEESVNDKEQE
jgi:hypothetical protein